MCTLALLGTVLSVGGALVEGQQSKQMADYQAKAYEQQAQADAQAAAFDQTQERHKQDLLQAQALAQAGASGVGIAGSPTEVLAANARQGQTDLGALLYGVNPIDPVTFGSMPAILIAVALLGCYIPARRATLVNPIVALKTD